MSDEIEKMLEGLSPRGAPTELRGQILGALAAEAGSCTTAADKAQLTPRARWKMLKRFATVAALLLLVLVPAYLLGSNIWIWSTEDRLEKRLAAIRDAGDPVTLPDLGRRAKDVRLKNAAGPLSRAGKDIQAMLKEISPVTETDDYQAGKLSEEDRKKLRAVFDAHAEVFDRVREAADCATYQPPIDYTGAPSAVITAAMADGADFRAVIRLLQIRSRLQLEEGHRHEALQTCLSLFRLVRLYDGSLFLVNGLVTYAGRAVGVESANRVLRSGAITDADRDALEAELARQDSHQGLIKTLKNERALGVSSYDLQKTWLGRPLQDQDEWRYLDLVQEQIDLAAKPYEKFVTAVKDFLATRGRFTPLADTWFPAAQKTREAHERTRGVVRCLRVLNALQRAGVKPEDGTPKLDVLKLPAGATTDPFTGKPLLVKVVDGDWVIYTVGLDLRDDGGDLAGAKDFGVGPAPAPGK
jgi:hypothetical protein